MTIEKYSFGKIVIDNEKYTNDVIIFPKRVKSDWWRIKGHFLQLKDIESILDENPEIVIFGTGAYGMMKIDPEVVSELQNKEITLIAEKTKKAVKIYNEKSAQSRVIAGLHLTC